MQTKQNKLNKTKNLTWLYLELNMTVIHFSLPNIKKKKEQFLNCEQTKILNVHCTNLFPLYTLCFAILHNMFNKLTTFYENV